MRRVHAVSPLVPWDTYGLKGGGADFELHEIYRMQRSAWKFVAVGGQVRAACVVDGCRGDPLYQTADRAALMTLEAQLLEEKTRINRSCVCVCAMRCIAITQKSPTRICCWSYLSYRRVIVSALDVK